MQWTHENSGIHAHEYDILNPYHTAYKDIYETNIYHAQNMIDPYSITYKDIYLFNQTQSEKWGRQASCNWACQVWTDYDCKALFGTILLQILVINFHCVILCLVSIRVLHFFVTEQHNLINYYSDEYFLWKNYLLLH